MAEDADEAKRQRAEWELYLMGVPTDQLLEELSVRRAVPLVAVYEDDFGDFTAFSSACADEHLSQMFLYLGSYLWGNYGKTHEEEADEGDD